MSETEFKSFEEFWPYYLNEHADPTNRVLHAIGTTSALTAATAAILLRKKWLFAVAPVLGYGPAWVGHFIIEKNRPATFKHPLWSLIGDFKMNSMMWKGTLQDELDRLGIVPGSDPMAADEGADEAAE